MFYCRHRYLVNCYGISVSQMTTNVPFVVDTISSFSRFFFTRLAGRIPQVELGLFNSRAARFLVGFALFNLKFSVYCFVKDCVSFHHFSGVHQFMVCGYRFSIFRLFFPPSLEVKENMHSSRWASDWYAFPVVFWTSTHWSNTVSSFKRE